MIRVLYELILKNEQVKIGFCVITSVLILYLIKQLCVGIT